MLLHFLPRVRSRNRELQELFASGIGMHHAGMLRSDRNLTERLFSDGYIKVCGWGVRVVGWRGEVCHREGVEVLLVG